MRFRDGLIAARSHIVFILALSFSIVLILKLEEFELGPDTAPRVELTPGIPDSVHRPLTQAETQAAAAAWRYFATQTRAETGFADMVADFPVATLWTAGSQIMATLSAEKLKLIPPREAEARIAALLAGLGRLPRFEDRLPGRFHNTVSLAPVDRDGQATGRETGYRDLGWSAVDLGRLLTALTLARRDHPGLAPSIDGLLAGWDLGAAVENRFLQAARRLPDGTVELHQEGRLGFEQYAAKGFALLGYDVSNAASLAGKLAWRTVEEVSVPLDARPSFPGTRTNSVSEPWIYDGLEYGWDRVGQELAWRIYKAQEARAAVTGLPVTAGEGPVDRKPWFVQQPVTQEGRDWGLIGGDAGEADQLRTAASKIAFGWGVLLGTPYADKLLAETAAAADAEKGWRAGIYTATRQVNGALSLETNAMILQSLAFRSHGPLMRSWMHAPATKAAAR